MTASDVDIELAQQSTGGLVGPSGTNGAVTTEEVPSSPAAPSRSFRLAPRLEIATVATGFLALVALGGWAGAERSPTLGLAIDALLLLGLLAASARRRWATPVAVERTAPATWYLCLALAPLTRIVIEAMPLSAADEPTRSALVAVPMVLAAMLGIRGSGYRLREAGLRFGAGWWVWPLHLVVAAAGIGIGVADHRLFAPPAAVSSLTLTPTAVETIAVLLALALAEEVLFRGLLLRASIDILGRPLAVGFNALAMGALLVGRFPADEIAFAMAVSAGLAVAVALTGSVLSAIAARGVAELVARVILPNQ